MSASEGRAQRHLRAAWGLLRVLKPGTHRARLRELARQGEVEHEPNTLQLLRLVGRMNAELVGPGVQAYYQAHGVSPASRVLLRFWHDPGLLIHPIGLGCDGDTLIRHLLAVWHGDPRYDLAMLRSLGGLDRLEQELEQVLAAEHPEQAHLERLMEDADYHGHLLSFVRAWRVDAEAELPPRPGDLREKEGFREAEARYGTLASAMREAAAL